MLAIADTPIDPRAVEAAVTWPGAGAVLTFLGIARDNFEGRAVRALEYEAYPELAEPVLAQIATEVQERWPGARVAIVHRTGRLEISEPSVVISVATPHRGACYEASRYAIDTLKARLPVWKKEVYDDGTAWKANAESPVQPVEGGA
jgi:molybdopterin synthase catalytic subunit